MPAPIITRLVVAALNHADIPHMLVGAFARNYYAEPRSTKDADLVLGVAVGSLRVVMDALGPEFRLEEQMTFETNTGTLKNVIFHPGSGFTVELFYLSEDAHDQERFKRRRATVYEGLPTFVLTAEDYIVTKLRWPRSKDYDDVRDVVAMQGSELDWNYINQWADRHGSRAKLDRIVASIPTPPSRAKPA